MSKEFFEAVKMLTAEKGISEEYLYDKISSAIVGAAKHDYNGKDIVHCDIDPEKQKITQKRRREKTASALLRSVGKQLLCQIHQDFGGTVHAEPAGI